MRMVGCQLAGYPIEGIDSNVCRRECTMWSGFIKCVCAHPVHTNNSSRSSLDIITWTIWWTQTSCWPTTGTSICSVFIKLELVIMNVAIRWKVVNVVSLRNNGSGCVIQIQFCVQICGSGTAIGKRRDLLIRITTARCGLVKRQSLPERGSSGRLAVSDLSLGVVGETRNTEEEAASGCCRNDFMCW